MRILLRAVRLCFKQPWTLAGAFTCSVLVALFWGANIGAVYPLMDVLFRDQSIVESVDEQIAACRGVIAEVDQNIGQLKAEQPAASPGREAEIEQELHRLRDRRGAEVYALSIRQRARPYLDRWLPKRAYPTLLVVIGALMTCTVLKSMLLMSNSILVERAIRRALMGVRIDYFSHAMRLDLANLNETGAGEVTSQFTYDMNALVGALRAVFGRATLEPLKMIACLIGAGFFCWRLLILSLVLVPIAGFLMQKLAGSIKRANRRAMEEMSSLVGQLSESLEAVHIVKAFTMEQYERTRFGKRAYSFYRKSMQIIFYNSLTKPVTEMFGIGVVCAALLTGGYLVLEQQTHVFGIKITDRPLTPEVLIAFFAMLVGASDPARKLAEVYNMIQPGVPAAERIFGMIDRQPAIREAAQPQPIASPHGRLTFENVSFHYGSGTPVLRQIDLEIPFGEALAIVGPNGCGKTTLANLIPRFYDPTNGTVRINGLDLRDVAIHDLRSRLGVVSQHTQLFDDTIANNIRYGSLEASEEQVVEAARQAHAHEFISGQLEDGYDTLVGLRGGKLSGGQRQRIALARAILRDPEILILDEATSQVDLESEQLVHQVLEKFIRGRTAIMITHRLSTLSLADRILVMEAGQIQDLGTHEQLLTRCPLYQRLHALSYRKSA